MTRDETLAVALMLKKLGGRFEIHPRDAAEMRHTSVSVHITEDPPCMVLELMTTTEPNAVAHTRMIERQR